MKRPAGRDAAPGPRNRCPLTNAPQVFEGNAVRGVFGLRDQMLADRMVNTCGKPSLLVSPSLQDALCGLGSPGLQPGAEPRTALSEAVHFATGVSLTIRVNCNIDNAEVDSKPIDRYLRNGFCNVNSHRQKEHAFAEDKVGLPTGMCEAFLLTWPIGDRNDLATLEGKDGYSFSSLPGQIALVVTDRPSRPEGRLNRSVALVDISDLADGTYGHLRRKPESRSNAVVDNLLQAELAGNLLTERDVGNLVTCSVEAFNGRK